MTEKPILRPSKTRPLHYVILNPRGQISLNLYEAERYEPAIIVQSLVGNLVYYSNKGRYEPRLARRWSRTAPNIWEFELLPNLTAENNEAITATSFKASIERTLRYLSKNGDFPVLMSLRGYSAFVHHGADLEGLKASGDKLTFEFDQPVRDGLLQVLSFAPFGYISAENLNNDGSWKDERKFISSGPYKVKSLDLGKSYVLTRRSDWSNPFAEGAPEEITFTLRLSDNPDSAMPLIVDSFTEFITPPPGLENYPLVPEYINPILLGGLENGYFSDPKIRRQFKSLLVRERDKLPPSWKVLKAVLENAHIPYTFANNKTNMKDLSNRDYDIRIRGASAGGGAEAWGLKILFCSDLGPKFPDPSNKVCDLIEDFENDRISEKDFSEGFAAAVNEAAAIIPISHYGVQLYLSPQINRESLSPTLSIMRFDQLEIN